MIEVGPDRNVLPVPEFVQLIMRRRDHRKILDFVFQGVQRFIEGPRDLHVLLFRRSKGFRNLSHDDRDRTVILSGQHGEKLAGFLDEPRISVHVGFREQPVVFALHPVECREADVLGTVSGFPEFLEDALQNFF